VRVRHKNNSKAQDEWNNRKGEEVAISLLNILIASQDELAEREDSNRDGKG